MLDLFEKLVDRCIQLVKARQEANRLYFDQFVTPAFEAFESVHRFYMDTFASCREQLNGSRGFDEACLAIVPRLQELILYRSDFRSKVYQLTTTAAEGSRSKGSWHAVHFADFVSQIEAYLGVNDVVDEVFGDKHLRLVRQRWSEHVLRRLGTLKTDASLTNEERCYVATASLDATVAEMQLMYAQVCQDYYTMKVILIR